MANETPKSANATEDTATIKGTTTPEGTATTEGTATPEGGSCRKAHHDCPETVHFHFDLSGINSGKDCCGENRLEIRVHVTFECLDGLPRKSDDEDPQPYIRDIDP